MGHWLKALTALAETLCGVLSTHIRCSTTLCSPSFRGSNTSGLCWTCTHMHIYVLILLKITKCILKKKKERKTNYRDQKNTDPGRGRGKTSRLLRMLYIISFSLKSIDYSGGYMCLKVSNYILKTNESFKNPRHQASACKHHGSNGASLGNSGKIPQSPRECGRSPRVFCRRACDLFVFISCSRNKPLKY